MRLASAEIIHKRLLGFLIWQFLNSSAVFIIFRALLLPLLASSSPSPTLHGLLAFLPFNLATLLFSLSLIAVSTPHYQPPASPLELLIGLFRLLILSGDSSPEFRSRAKVSLGFLLVVTASAISGSLAVASICWVDSDGVLVLGFRGFSIGFLYGLYFVYTRRWVLQFPIIQRPAFFSFKMGVASAVSLALKLACVAYLLSALLVLALPDYPKGWMSFGKFRSGQLVFYFGSFAVIFCWEISHHLHKILLTKRAIFAPPKGSAAAETNPSEPLIASLEESSPGSLLQYLAYLDMSLVCESNVDVWRRAALFEETGETYKTVVSLSLRPLEQLASSISEVIETTSFDKASQLSRQLQSTSDMQLSSKVHACFDNFQV
uniref:Nucleoporin protein Ndc1-Nup n=1 Tax=Kalanchoe fedtschenkoi TaxID=63787 RepID=A0A7N0UE67_KALFE